MERWQAKPWQDGASAIRDAIAEKKDALNALTEKTDALTNTTNELRHEIAEKTEALAGAMYRMQHAMNEKFDRIISDLAAQRKPTASRSE